MLYDVIRDSTKLKEALSQAYMAGAAAAGVETVRQLDFEGWYRTLEVTERGVRSEGAYAVTAWD